MPGKVHFWEVFSAPALGLAVGVGLFAFTYLSASFYLFQRDSLLNDRQALLQAAQKPLQDQMAQLKTELAKAKLTQLDLEKSVVEQRSKYEEERLLNQQIASAISAMGEQQLEVISPSDTLDRKPDLASLSAFAPLRLLEENEGQAAISNGLLSLHANLQKKSKTLLNVLRSVDPDTELEDEPGHAWDSAYGNGDPNKPERVLSYLRQDLNQLSSYKAKVANLPIANPVPNAKITSRYGRRRDPFTKETRYHSGMDFKAPIGTPIYASGNGTIIRAGWAGGYGKMVEIRHPNGLISRYAHMNEIAVKKGDAVVQGFQIGATGNTGRSTGPHLHYELRKNEKAQNPKPFFDAWRRLIPVPAKG
jgi:murein DD-endopeptidase MepM/ murein hydrolase activator NlpD